MPQFDTDEMLRALVPVVRRRDEPDRRAVLDGQGSIVESIREVQAGKFGVLE